MIVSMWNTKEKSVN